MFGKPLGEYLSFQKAVLILIALVWAVRLGLSLAGVPDAAGKYVSITAVLVATAFYYPWSLHQSGFGSFKQLYALSLIQGVYSQTLVALTIVLAIVTGHHNIFTVPEFYPPSSGGGAMMPVDGKNFGHAHIFFAGGILLPLVVWLVGSVELFVLRKASPRPARG